MQLSIWIVVNTIANGPRTVVAAVRLRRKCLQDWFVVYLIFFMEFVDTKSNKEYKLTSPLNRHH